MWKTSPTELQPSTLLGQTEYLGGGLMANKEDGNFQPLPGEMIQFDWYLSYGLKPATRYLDFVYSKMISYFSTMVHHHHENHNLEEPDIALWICFKAPIVEQLQELCK